MDEKLSDQYDDLIISGPSNFATYTFKSMAEYEAYVAQQDRPDIYYAIPKPDPVCVARILAARPCFTELHYADELIKAAVKGL